MGGKVALHHLPHIVDRVGDCLCWLWLLLRNCLQGNQH
jgi:hypothetical protein